MVFPRGSVGKETACNEGDAGDVVFTSGSRRSLEEDIADHFSVLARRIPWTEKPGGLQSKQSQRVGNKKQLSTHSYPINNVVIVSSEQQRDSAIHIHVSILLQTPLPSRLPHNTEQSSLCSTAGPCLWSILNIAVCTCPSQTPKLSLPPILAPGEHKFVLTSLSLFLCNYFL